MGFWAPLLRKFDSCRLGTFRVIATICVPGQCDAKLKLCLSMPRRGNERDNRTVSPDFSQASREWGFFRMFDQMAFLPCFMAVIGFLGKSTVLSSYYVQMSLMLLAIYAYTRRFLGFISPSSIEEVDMVVWFVSLSLCASIQPENVQC
jgi:hypothetical protein